MAIKKNIYRISICVSADPIYLKTNNLVSQQIIKLLYDASDAGVEIRLIVRGMLSLVSGKKNLSENIQSKGLIDRYLEHTRISIFCNDGNEKIFISSADWMDRNLDRRIEVTCPIYDKEIKKFLLDIFEIQWKDTEKNRTLDVDDFNQIPKRSKKIVNSQLEIQKYLKVE
jgi:polyphosphate kinase